MGLRGQNTLRVGEWIEADMTSVGEVTSIKRFERRRFRSMEESGGGASGGERGFPFGR